MTETKAIKLMMTASRIPIDASAQTVGSPNSGEWCVHLDHGRRIIHDAEELEEEIARIVLLHGPR